MKLSSILFPEPPSTPMSVGLLLLRVVAGASMASHGWGKIQNPFHWLDKADSPPPALLQALAALAEFGGGLALVFGVLTVVASFGIACTMVEAIRFHLAAGDAFGKWELAALYLALSVLFFFGGPGKLSIDALVRARLTPR